MRGKTVIFSLLFLPLWLAAVACNISSAPGVDVASDQVGSSAPSGQNDSGKSQPPLKHAVHHLVRRVAFSSEAGDHLLSGDAEFQAAINDSQPRVTLFSVVEAPANLRHSWQFHLRSAGSPRAPSILS